MPCRGCGSEAPAPQSPGTAGGQPHRRFFPCRRARGTNRVREPGHGRSRPRRRFFRVSCPPTQSPAGRLLHRGFDLPRGLGSGTAGAGLPAILSGVVPAAAIACRQAPTPRLRSAARPGQRHCRSRPAGDSFRAPCPPRQSPAGRLLHRGFDLPRGLGSGTVGAGLAGDSFRAPCTPRQSPAGRLLHRGFDLPRGRGSGTVGAGLPAILSGRRARRGNRLQAGSYTAASICHGAWAAAL